MVNGENISVHNSFYLDSVYVQSQIDLSVYYSEKGITVLTRTNDYPNIAWIAKTAWSFYDYDETTQQIIEVAKRYAK